MFNDKFMIMEFFKDYLLFVVCVAFLTEGVKMRLPAEKLHPKWTSLIVAIILGVLYVFTPYFDGNYLHLLLAFGVSIIFYDYFFKVGVDLIKNKFTFKK